MKGHSNHIEKPLSNKDLNNIQMLTFMLKNIGVATILESTDKTIEFVNKDFCNLFNIVIPPSELIGINSKEIIKASGYLCNNPESFNDRLENIIQQGIEIEKEIIKFSDGRYFELDYKPVVLENDFISGHLWIYRDVTAHKKLELNNQSQQIFYQKVLNNIPADIAIFDKEQKYIFVNRLGITKDVMRDWLVGKDDFDYFLSKNKGFERAISRRNYFEQAMTSLQVVQFEEKDINRKGQEISNLRHFYPYVNEEKEVEFVVGYGVNISKIRQNEKLLIRSLETYQNLIHNLDEVVFIVDINNILQYVNPLWEKVFNKSYYESVGNPLVDYFSPEIYERIDKDLHQIKTDFSIDKIKGEIKLEGVDGIVKHYNYYFGRFYGILKEEVMISGFVVDVTDQVNAREELLKILQKERMLSDMKTVFVNMVSHELRTPLSIIQSSAEILELLYQQANPSKETLESYTFRIVDEVNNLKILMDELLLISRIETDKLQFNANEIDIIGFIDEIINHNYNPWKDNRNLTLEVRGTTQNIKGDRFMLKHIINNILDNAFKYSPEKESPILRLFFGHDSWSLVCRDYGIGIPENEIKTLGTSFRRGSNAGFIPGTGLGLVVVNYFVEKHKGHVQYQSSIGKGTFVRITFPY